MVYLQLQAFNRSRLSAVSDAQLLQALQAWSESPRALELQVPFDGSLQSASCGTVAKTPQVALYLNHKSRSLTTALYPSSSAVELKRVDG